MIESRVPVRPHLPLLTDPVIRPPDYSSNKDASASRSLAPPFPLFVMPLSQIFAWFCSSHLFSKSSDNIFFKFKANTPHSPDFNSPHSPDFLYQSYSLLRFILFSLPPIYFMLYLFIYLAMPGLSCGMWDLVPSSSLTRGPLHWKHVISAPGPGKLPLTATSALPTRI